MGKLEEMDDTKKEVFEMIKEAFEKSFKKPISNDVIFDVANGQAIAIKQSLVDLKRVNCMFLGSFRPSPYLIELHRLRDLYMEREELNVYDATIKASAYLDEHFVEFYEHTKKVKEHTKMLKKAKLANRGTYKNKSVNINKLDLKF